MPTKVVLTPRMVDTLKTEPGKEQTIYQDVHDDAPKGFALRVYSSGARAFYLLAMVPTTKARVWVKIGPAKGTGLKDSRIAATATAGQIALGVNPNEAREEAKARAEAAKRQQQREATEPTVAELFRRYVDARRTQLSPATSHEYDRLARVVLEPSPFGKKKARLVVRNDVRSFLDAKARKAPAVADHLLAVLRACWRWARTEESEAGVPMVAPDRDPLFGLKPYKGLVKRTRHLSDEEIVVFWRGVENLKLCSASYLRIILLTGTRRGETYNARWADVDLDAGIWRIPAEHRKGREGRREKLDVPLSPLAVRTIRDLRPITGNRPRIFVGQGISTGSVGKEMKASTGLQDVSIHDLRRSCASGLQRIGAPPHVISRTLGHAHEEGAVAVDAHYVHGGRPNEVKFWLEKWATYIERLLGEGQTATVVPIRA